MGAAKHNRPSLVPAERAGVPPGVKKIVFHAEDGYESSIPLLLALSPEALMTGAAAGGIGAAVEVWFVGAVSGDTT